MFDDDGLHTSHEDPMMQLIFDQQLQQQQQAMLNSSDDAAYRARMDQERREQIKLVKEILNKLKQCNDQNDVVEIINKHRQSISFYDEYWVLKVAKQQILNIALNNMQPVTDLNTQQLLNEHRGSFSLFYGCFFNTTSNKINHLIGQNDKKAKALFDEQKRELKSCIPGWSVA